MNIKNHSGKTFGSVKLIKKIPNRVKFGEHYRTAYEGICSLCGSIRLYNASHLKNTTHCGCLRLPKGYSVANQVFRLYENGAKRRNMEFNISFKEFYDLSQKNCTYCNCKPKTVRKIKDYNGVYIYNGLDRKDNNKGYTSDNCVPCCADCNRAKWQMTYQEFLDWTERLSKNIEKNNLYPSDNPLLQSVNNLVKFE